MRAHFVVIGYAIPSVSILATILIFLELKKKTFQDLTEKIVVGTFYLTPPFDPSKDKIYLIACSYLNLVIYCRK